MESNKMELNDFLIEIVNRFLFSPLKPYVNTSHNRNQYFL